MTDTQMKKQIYDDILRFGITTKLESASVLSEVQFLEFSENIHGKMQKFRQENASKYVQSVLDTSKIHINKLS